MIFANFTKFIRQLQLAVIFLNNLVEANVSPSSGDFSEPILPKFIQFATTHCVIAILESILLLSWSKKSQTRSTSQTSPTSQRAKTRCRNSVCISRVMQKLDLVAFLVTSLATAIFILVIQTQMLNQHPKREINGLRDYKTIFFPAT